MTTSTRYVQLPGWFIFVRIAQGVLAVLTIGLTGFAASVWGVFSGFGLDWWTCIFTFAFLGYWFFAARKVIAKWNITWFHLAFEIMTCFWWLTTFSVIGSEASYLSSVEGIANAYLTAYGDAYSFGPTGDAALGCMKGVAVAGAIEFVLFLVTIGFFIPAMQRAHRGQGVAQNPSHQVKVEQGYPGPQQQYQTPSMMA